MNYHTSCEIQMRRSKMTDIKEILRLISLGIPQKKIAESCKCSRDTVMRVHKKAKSFQITWPLDASISDEALIPKFYPKSSIASEFKMPGVKYIHKKLMKNGVTLKLLWRVLRKITDLEKYLITKRPMKFSGRSSIVKLSCT